MPQQVVGLQPQPSAYDCSGLMPLPFTENTAALPVSARFAQPSLQGWVALSIGLGGCYATPPGRA